MLSYNSSKGADSSFKNISKVDNTRNDIFISSNNDKDRIAINENKLYSPVRNSKNLFTSNDKSYPQSPVRGCSKNKYSLPDKTNNYKLPNYISSPNFQNDEAIDLTSDPYIKDESEHVCSGIGHSTGDNSLPERTIVLDVDETLLYTSVIIGTNNNKNIGDRNFFESVYNFRISSISYSHLFNYLCFKSNFNTLYSWVTFRPYLYEYLKFIGHYFDHVAIWSAGIREYIEPLVDLMFKNQDYYPELVWCRSECKLLRSGKLTKPLIKISNFKGWDYNNMILIDDQIYNFDMNKVNGDDNKLQGILTEPFCPFKNEVTNNDKAINNGIEKIKRDDYLLRQIEYFNDILSINDTELRNLGSLVNEYKMYNKYNVNKLDNIIGSICTINPSKKYNDTIPTNPNMIY